MGYAAWVEAVWVNYINNAIKYGGVAQTGVKPIVRLGWDTVTSPSENSPESDANPESFIRYWVQDNGVALPKASRDKLFIEFTRLDHRISEGHGLGLSITKRIIEKLGGKVGVESTPGVGNTFYFTLPACDFNFIGTVLDE